MNIFKPEFFKTNRDKLRDLVGLNAPIIMTAHGLLQRTGDSAYTFRQNSNFWYLTGVDLADFILVIDKNNEYLIAPKRSQHQILFEGDFACDQLTKTHKIDVLDNKTGYAKLKNQVKKSKKYAGISAQAEYIADYGLYTNPARAGLYKTIKEINSGIELIDIAKTLANMRVIKQPAELVAIKRAINITGRAIDDIRANLQRYSYEYQVEADISRSFKMLGAAGHGFEPIVASGKNACTLHNFTNRDKLAKNKLLLLDIGAEYSNYSADISRTIAYAQPSKRQKAVYQAVSEVQKYAISLIKPGVLLRENERLINEFMGKKLLELKLIKSNSIKNARQYYKHSTSHFLGLDVHDVGDYSQPLQPGMVLTVEPGVYIDKEGLGVRIEDDILVTENGNEVLSNKIPNSLC